MDPWHRRGYPHRRGRGRLRRVLRRFRWNAPDCSGPLRSPKVNRLGGTVKQKRRRRRAGRTVPAVPPGTVPAQNRSRRSRRYRRRRGRLRVWRFRERLPGDALVKLRVALRLVTGRRAGGPRARPGDTAGGRRRSHVRGPEPRERRRRTRRVTSRGSVIIGHRIKPPRPARGGDDWRVGKPSPVVVPARVFLGPLRRALARGYVAEDAGVLRGRALRRAGHAREEHGHDAVPPPRRCGPLHVRAGVRGRGQEHR